MEENFKIDIKAKRILIVTIIFIIAPLIAIVYWKALHSISGWDLVLKNASAMSFHGRVDSIYYDKQDHNTETLILSDGNLFKLYPNWALYVAVGDSLAKDTGNVQVVVYKNSKQVNVLDYKELIKHFRSKN